MDGLKYPVYIKPVHLGSSIGVKKAGNKKELDEALDVAFFYDQKVLVEQGVTDAKEVNVSMIRNNPYEVSTMEMPVATSDVLSFKDKYLAEGGKSRGMASLKRIIPAPIRKETEKMIEKYAKRFFAEIGGEGIVRMDFLFSSIDNKKSILTIPSPPISAKNFLAYF